MALLEDLTDEEQQRLLGSSAAGGGGAASGQSAGSEAAPAPSSGQFTSLASYFGANQGAGAAMGDRVASDLESRATNAIMGDDVAGAQDTLGDIETVQTAPGLASTLAEQAGGTYTPGMASFDAYLIGREGGGDRLAGLKSAFGQRLSNVEPFREAPTAPGERPEVLAGPTADDVWGLLNGPAKDERAAILQTQAEAAKKSEQDAQGWDQSAQDYNAQLDDYNAWLERRAQNQGTGYTPLTPIAAPEQPEEQEEEQGLGGLLRRRVAGGGQ